MLVIFLVSLNLAFSEDGRTIADQKRAQAVELRKQAAEKREIAAAKTYPLNALKAEKEKADKEISEIEREILPKKREYEQLNSQYEEKNNRYNGNNIKSDYLSRELSYGEETPEISSLTQSLKSEAGGPLGEIKNGLNQAADGLENIFGSLKQAGLSDQEINNIFQTVGVNPTQLSQDLRQASNGIPGGPMTQYELRQWHNRLTIEYEKAKQDQAKARGPDYENLKQQVSRYDEILRQKEADKRFWEKKSEEHSKEAEKLWEPCKRIFESIFSFFGCLNPIDKLILSWHKTASATDWITSLLTQTDINKIRSERGIPAGQIAFADVAASPYTFTVELLDKQRKDIEEEIAKIKNKIRSEMKRLNDENKQLKDDINQLGNKMDKINAEIAPIRDKIAPLKQKSENFQKDIQKIGSEINSILLQASIFEGQAKLLIEEAEAIEAASPARAGETCNPGIAHYQQTGCIENATPSTLSDWDGLPCPGPSVPSYAQAGCIPQQ